MSNFKKNYKKKSSVVIDSQFRIKIEKDIEEFVNSNFHCFEFPSTLTNVERAFVHNLAPKYNLKTRSSGKDDDRRLSLFKPTENDEFLNRRVKIKMDLSSVNILKQFNRECPKKKIVMEKVPHEVKNKTNMKPLGVKNSPTVPPPSNANSLVHEKKQNLPISAFRDEILHKIKNNRILLVSGSTGSGKTTQIPQMILENANLENQPCRILCTQPRRISAIASADRVCYERNEEAGTTIGYQIRLESKISPNTNCIFMTPGVFLRYLMSGKPEEILGNITHVLIDEAHERAKENDFLLTSIKENINANPNLKIIIMSATMNTAVFSDYFGGSETISIATKQFEVEEVYLEEILKTVNFRNRRVDELDEMFQSGKLVAASQSAYVNENNDIQQTQSLDVDTAEYLNEILESLSSSESPEAELNQFIYLVQAENAPVNFRHEKTNMTALMIAVGRGLVSSADALLKLDADPYAKVLFGDIELNSLDIAYRLHGEDSEIKRIIQFHMDNSKPKELSTSEMYNKQLVNIYYDTVLTTKTNNFIVEEGIDHELITSLIEKIHTSSAYDGAILVFLPGFEDIIQVSNMIGVRLRNNDFTLFLLHSSMKTDDQKNVFKQVFNRRKIILSTNIAESSITINDVVYVIDSGREKQKSYDAISHSSSLQVQWISKASAKQRRGRAGRLRNGVVFRVYSKDRYNSMLETTIPELLRTSLTEICLQTKLIIGDAMSIETFLGKCIATPSIPSIRQSIKLLQCLGALDKNESLTFLGSHLAEMPVDARFAKMLVYASALKCLNPVLNIVSILSMGDQIFILPTKPADRFRCHEVRRKFGGDSLSDHFVMLKIFQDFVNLKGNERRFCEENFISIVALERAKGIRGQISSYLQKSGLLKGDDNRNSEKWSLVKACLCCGLYPNIARIDRSKKMMYSDIDRKLVFHMSSNLCVKNERSMDYVKFFPSDWCIFEEKNRIGRTSMIRCNTLVNSFSVSLAAGSSLTAEIITSIGDWSEEEENTIPQLMIKLDNLVTFEMENEDGKLLMDLRVQLDEFIFRFLTMRDFRFEKEDDLLISTIACVVDIEETKSGFIKMNLKNDEHQFRSNQRRNNNKAPNHFINFSSETSRNNQGWSRQQQSSSFMPPKQQTSDFAPPQQSRYVPPHKRPDPQKFFVLKINNEAKINEWARSSLINLDQLQLNQWFMNRICHPSVMKSQIFIFFYSTKTSAFHGFGDIMPSKKSNQPMFHFRIFKNLTMAELRKKFFFKDFTIAESFQTEELSNEVGSALIDIFQA